MNMTSLGGGANDTKLTIEGYLDVLGALEPCKYIATVAYENGPIHISRVESPKVKERPLAIVYEVLTGKRLKCQAAFFLPELEPLGLHSGNVLGIRLAEMGLCLVGQTSVSENLLRKRILEKLSHLLLASSFPCVRCDDDCDFRQGKVLTPAA
jgi:hypothetical protein